MMQNGIRLNAIGDLDRLPDDVREKLASVRAETAGNMRHDAHARALLRRPSGDRPGGAPRRRPRRARRSRRRTSRRRSGPAGFPSSTCSSARAASGASRTSSSGSAPTPSCTSPRCSGRTSGTPSCSRPSPTTRRRERRFGLTGAQLAKRARRVANGRARPEEPTEPLPPRRVGGGALPARRLDHLSSAGCRSRCSPAVAARGGRVRARPHVRRASAWPRCFGIAVAGAIPFVGRLGRRAGALLPGWSGLALACATVVLLAVFLFRRGPLEAMPRSVSVVALAWLYCGVLLASGRRAPAALRRGLGDPRVRGDLGQRHLRLLRRARPRAAQAAASGSRRRRRGRGSPAARSAASWARSSPAGSCRTSRRRSPSASRSRVGRGRRGARAARRSRRVDGEAGRRREGLGEDHPRARRAARPHRRAAVRGALGVRVRGLPPVGPPARAGARPPARDKRIRSVKRVAILGSTGSIGVQALDVVARSPIGSQVVGLAAGRNAARLAEQVRRFRPRVVSVADEAAAARGARGGAARHRGARRRGGRRRGRLASRTSTSCSPRSPAARGCAPPRPRSRRASQWGSRTRSRSCSRASSSWRAPRRRACPSCPSTPSTAPSTSRSSVTTAREVRRLILTASGGPLRLGAGRRARRRRRPSARSSTRTGRWAPRSPSTRRP